jgi:hypothetical protein
MADKPDFTMPDGQEIIFDLDKISIREYRKFATGSMMSEDDDTLLAKVSGLTVEDIGNLPQPQYRLLLRAFFEKAREPLADPN